MLRNITFIVFLLIVQTYSAFAEYVFDGVLFIGPSYHTEEYSEDVKLTNNSYGFGLFKETKYINFYLGVFNNSYDKTSYFINLNNKTYTHKNISFYLNYGIYTGYPENKSPVSVFNENVFIFPSLEYQLNNKNSLGINLLVNESTTYNLYYKHNFK